jgi:hypothetical protein
VCANNNNNNNNRYECVLTIMHIEAEAGLRVMAVNLLGRFLSNPDNNTRFVGLKTLSMVIHRDKSAVGRHKNTIIDCLKDPDETIRKRAMELIFELVDAENVRTLAREMLNYLVTSKDESGRAELCDRITQVVDQFAPNAQWHLETLITMMSVGGASVTDDAVSRVVRIVTQEPSLQPAVTHKLYRMLSEDLSQVPLTEVGIWTIGECVICFVLFSFVLSIHSFIHSFAFVCSFIHSFTYAVSPHTYLHHYHFLLRQTRPLHQRYGQHLATGGALEEGGAVVEPVADADVVTLLNKCIKIYSSTDGMKGMALTALTKLAPKMPEQRARIEKIVAGFRHSLRTDLQQRSVEYVVETLFCLLFHSHDVFCNY